MSTFRDSLVEGKDNGLADLQKAWNKYRFELDKGTEAKAAGWKKKVDALAKKVLKQDPDALDNTGKSWAKKLNEAEELVEAKKPDEFVIWGIAPDKTKEEILYTKATSEASAKKIMKSLVDQHDCTKVRLQVIDFSTKIDFIGAVK